VAGNCEFEMISPCKLKPGTMVVIPPNSIGNPKCESATCDIIEAAGPCGACSRNGILFPPGLLGVIVIDNSEQFFEIRKKLDQD
jgi:hypothetical protein